MTNYNNIEKLEFLINLDLVSKLLRKINQMKNECPDLFKSKEVRMHLKTQNSSTGSYLSSIHYKTLYLPYSKCGRLVWHFCIEKSRRSEEKLCKKEPLRRASFKETYNSSLKDTLIALALRHLLSQEPLERLGKM